MSMTSETVCKMAAELQAAKLHESNTDTNPEVEVEEEVKPEVVETNDTTSENDNVSDDTSVQETVVESEDKPEKVSSEKPSHKDQEKYAFAKLKNKERQKREKLISDYESKIKSLNDELEHFKDLKKESFGTDEEYVNYLFDRKLKEQESNQLQLQKANAEAEAFEEINQQRIMNCFPDEKDREIYNKLIETSAKPFVEMLEKADPDNAVLSYLDDSDISPLLIRVMMTKPDLRNEVLSKRSPYSKVLALDNLAKRLTYAKNIVDRKRSKAPEKEKKPLPVIGKVTKTDSPSVIDKKDPNFYNDLLHKMNQRKR